MKIGLDESGQVITEPLDSLSELLQWNPENFSFNKSVIQKQVQMVANNDSLRKGLEPSTRPQVLVCHDMCGGYLDDRFCQGSSSVSPYCFYHWQLIDSFVYFSHHFITIPPVGWIQAAHKHGVDILGTIITEWETGSSICQEMLQSTSVIDRVTTKLAQMALAYGFNGWLINIENKIEIDHIPGLQYFVHELTLKCRAMLDAPKVLWYDSVINTGELKWQNELNALNEMFFQVCDGIFLNYCISNDHLSHSKMMAASYGRQFDVYVGVDAFGRGTPGGGGFNCREVMEMIQTHGLSCALFAPGWTYEKHPKEHFDVQEVMFWGLLNDRMSTRTVKVPFSTSFCRGYGNQYFLEGQSLSESPWYNLCVQQIQPSFTQSQFYRYTLAKTVRQVTEKTGEAKEEIDVKVHSEVQHPANPSMDFDVSCGYIGGGCLKLFAERIQSQAVCFKLFKLDSDYFKSLEISVVWKASCIDDFSFALALTSADEEKIRPIFTLLETTSLSDKQRKDMSLQLCEVDPSICVQTIRQMEETNLKNGFTKSTFLVSSSKFIEAGYKDNLFILSAILVPCDNVGALNSCMTVHIGHITVHEYHTALFPRPSLNNMLCWTLKADLPLSIDDMHKILINPYLNINLQNTKTPPSTEESSISFNTDSVSKSQGSISVSSFSAQNCDIVSSLQSALSQSSSELSNPIYILKWSYSSSMNIDYILVSSYDQSGQRKLLGQTVGEKFVYVPSNDDNKLVSFSIQPIFPFANSIGDEQFYKL
ncbi:uncharacterized protein LOC106055275 isoform X1 [Biomphalaria glabrata]|uniref:Cytosolic endo-beta-N-acetylglucosaminidase n=1 Tax=Biomphalaria glabrata TaxID=6526 RepID=A0A9W2ZME3_BIOGL|nr:uncharacterized protein LOC106055275 isoform X1 [Biomphalaria glabrata]